MEKSELKSYKKTLKKMIGLAQDLSKNEVPIVYELGHYLADNVLSKVCMIVAFENKNENLIYKKDRSGNLSNQTKDFPQLYKEILEFYYPKVMKYNELVKSLHASRSRYQHKFDSLKMTFHQAEAERYVEFVIDTMKKTKILGEYEYLPKISLLNKAVITQNYTIKLKSEKYQALYDILKDRNKKDIIIAIKNQLQYLMSNLKTDLVMEKHGRRDIILRNSDWSISIYFNGVIITNENTNESFAYYEPNKNIHVLEEFLKYYRNRLKEHGIEIKQ